MASLSNEETVGGIMKDVDICVNGDNEVIMTAIALGFSRIECYMRMHDDR